MKNVGKKLCVFLLVAVMVVGLLPAAAFAAGGDIGGYFGTGPDATIEKDMIPYLTNIFETASGVTKGYAEIGAPEKITGSDNVNPLQATITITDADKKGQEFLTSVVGAILETLHDGYASNNSAILFVKPDTPDPSTCLPNNNPPTCLGGNPGTCMSADGTLWVNGLTGNSSEANDKICINDFCTLTGLMTEAYKTARDYDGKGFAIQMRAEDLKNLTATCTFVFVLPKLEIKDEEHADLTVDKGTVSGTDLVDETKATGKTVEDVKRLFEDVAGTGATIQIMKADGKTEITDPTAKVGTGCVVELVSNTNGSVLDRVVVIVQGDTDGNGDITHLDAQKVMNDVAGITKLDGVYATAGHMADQQKPLSHIDGQRILNLIANSTKE